MVPAAAANSNKGSVTPLRMPVCDSRTFCIFDTFQSPIKQIRITIVLALCFTSNKNIYLQLYQTVTKPKISSLLRSIMCIPQKSPLTLLERVIVKTASTVSKLFQNVPEHSSMFWTFVPDSFHFPSFFDVIDRCQKSPVTHFGLQASN